MIKKIFLFLIILPNVWMPAATEPVLLHIGQHAFSVTDFEYSYRKNSQHVRQPLDEGLAQYIRFKMKVIAARDAGLDSLPALIDKGTTRRNSPVPADYMDGCLLFAITEREVFQKARADTAGQLDFYRRHAKAYRWEKRMVATLYRCSNQKTAIAVGKTINNRNLGNGRLPDGLFTFFCDRDGVNPCLDTVRMTLPKGANTIAKQIKWKKGVSKILEWNGKFVFLDVHSILRPARKTFEEARGTVVADYEAALEQEWVEALIKKYPVEIDKNSWVAIKKKYGE